MSELGILGPRVIGREAFEKEKALKNAGGAILGPRVIGNPLDKLKQQPAAPVMPPAPVIPEAPSLPPAPELDGAAAPPPPADDGTVPNPLEGINFASDQAMEAAAANGLTSAHFHDRTPTSVKGFNLADVRKIKLELEAAAPPPPPPAGTASIEDIDTVLNENPSLVDELLSAELQRVEGPRLAALRRLREVEGQRPGGLGGPRADILGLIDAELTKRTRS
jgi:hypothetical protein